MKRGSRRAFRAVLAPILIGVGTALASCSSSSGGGDEPAADVSGNWRGTYTSAEAGGGIRMTINQNGNRISGTFATSDEGGGTIEGQVNGDSFTFDVGLPAACPGDISGDGDVNGGSMTLHFSGYDCETDYTNGYAELNRY